MTGNLDDGRSGGADVLAPVEHIKNFIGRDKINNYYGQPFGEFERSLNNVPSRRNLPFQGRDDLLQDIGAALGEPTGDAVVVLRGPPGVGKSELAREFARLRRAYYPGGTFLLDGSKQAVSLDLARIGRIHLRLRDTDLSREDQALQALAVINGGKPALLLYDNVMDPDAILPWLPASGAPCHVIATTTMHWWKGGWLQIEVKPLSDADAIKLLEKIAGADVAQQFGSKLAAIAGGLPVQIVHAAAALDHDQRRGRLSDGSFALSEEAIECFLGAYRRLDEMAQLLLHASVRHNPQRIDCQELRQHFSHALGWGETEFNRRLDACLDLHLLQGSSELRMHQLLAAFVMELPAAATIADPLREVGMIQARRLTAIAAELIDQPNRVDLAAKLFGFSLDAHRWARWGIEGSSEDMSVIGRALVEVGAFSDALHWLERGAALNEKAGVDGRIDYSVLGSSLNQVGHCLSSLGKFDEALSWFQRSVAAAERGDLGGRVNSDELGSSLNQMGHCLASMNRFDEAQDLFERAVKETEKGDDAGRVNHEHLSNNLHQIGRALASKAEFRKARQWYERAVSAGEQGDVDGRIDYDSIGQSLYQVGYCLISDGEFSEALPWFERSALTRDKGDIHGRVDHNGLGTSFALMGYCLAKKNEFAAALTRYEQAIAAKERGDIHGRIDYESLCTSIRSAAVCLDQLGQAKQAMEWRARAEEIEAKLH